jgi:ADP-heptose:LPS heptosyltransferase
MMKFSRQKKIDKWVGPPLVWLAARLIPKKRCPEFPPRNVKEILIVKFLGFGTILLSMPLVKSLHRLYPRARITYLTFEANRDVLEMCPGVDRIITVDGSKVTGFIFSTLKLLSSLRREKIDICINLEFFSCYGTLISRLANPRCSLAYWGNLTSRALLYNRFVSYERSRHISEKMLNFAYALGAPEEPWEYEHPEPGREAAENVQKLIESLPPFHRPVVAVYVSSNEKAPKRKWLPRRYAEVVRWLLETKKATVLFIGGGADVDDVTKVKQLVGDSPDCHNLAGRLSLKELAALLTECGLFFGNDGGPFQLAVSLGVPTVSLFGPESPEVYGPPKNDSHTVIYSGISCSPCLNIYAHKSSPCSENECMQKITSGIVMEAIDRQLDRGIMS